MALYDEIRATRLAWAENDAKRDAGVPEPEGIRKIEDIVYTTSATKEEEPWHMTDIYFPEPWEGKDYPETFLMVSVNDPLLPASEVMKKKLEACSVPCEYHEYGQTNPADAHVFHVNLRSEEGKRCNKEELDFFLRGK